MKCLIAALLLFGLPVAQSFSQQVPLKEDPQDLITAQSKAAELSKESASEVLEAVLGGKKWSNSEWYIVERNGGGRNAQIILVTNCSALSICSSHPDMHLVISALCDTGCKEDWLPPSGVYAWISLDRTHNGYRFETKDPARKVVWTYWNIKSVAATNRGSVSVKPSYPTAAPSESSRTVVNSVLEISSTPAGAEIEIDGSYVGDTPTSIQVPAGKHVLKLKKSGYDSWSETSTRNQDMPTSHQS